jgi:DNA-directed RNA polymerase subunit RPC12/RpoP
MTTAYQCRTCSVEGQENFYKNAKYQCKACWNKRTFQSARDKLDQLIEERGAQCEQCGYNRCRAALEWHHKDAAEKEFSISDRRGKNIDELRTETNKCLLLCANCHREAHSFTGLITQ